MLCAGLIQRRVRIRSPQMKLKRRWNERTRLILTLELAVVLPAAALVILSALHLKQVQREHGFEAAIQREFGQILAISEKQINHRAYELVDDARNDFPGIHEACSHTLDQVLAARPYLAHVFLFDPERGLVFRSQPHRLNKDEQFRAES